MSRKKPFNWKWLRRTVWERDDYLCHYCRLQMDFQHPLITIDHIVPFRDCKSWDIDNLVTACQPCNMTRDGQPPSAKVASPNPTAALRGVSNSVAANNALVRDMIKQ